MSDSITFKFTLTEDDFVRAAHAHALSQRRWWITWAIFFGLWLVPLVSVLLQNGLTGEMLYQALPLLTGLASVAVFFALAWSWQPRRSARRSPFLGSGLAGIANAHGLDMSGSLGGEPVPWGSYDTVLEADHHFLLYPARNQYAPLPKRAFTSREDLRQFREMIRENIPSANLWKKP